jgi:hypothetical protein
VRLVFSVVKRKDMGDAIRTIRSFTPDALVTIEDMRMVKNGTFPLPEPKSRRYMAGIKSVRKWK